MGKFNLTMFLHQLPDYVIGDSSSIPSLMIMVNVTDNRTGVVSEQYFSEGQQKRNSTFATVGVALRETYDLTPSLLQNTNYNPTAKLALVVFRSPNSVDFSLSKGRRVPPNIQLPAMQVFNP
ncbi:hypothetical protein PIB30_094791 [Stylosanthes scabra]|uniref:Uncharacterized protein n=1 Tax=Stylosanthes scabra TaxID=79078 RepID=A0ABU6YVS6_9FABA|nr:hypothetical protein [Stylosanthes scabra]